MRTILRFLAVAFAGVLAAGPAHAQVQIAPTALTLDAAQAIGTLIVNNPSNEAREVRLYARFGYDSSDEQGNRTINYGDTARAAVYGLDPYVKIFPQRFIIQPGAQQEVRIMTKVPPSAPHAVYWTRLVTESKALQRVAATAEDAILARLNIEVQQIIPLVYVGKPASTMLTVQDIAYNEGANRPEIAVNVRRVGDAPFLGSVTLRVTDADGEVVQAFSRPSSVYFDFTEKIPLDRSQLEAGTYRAEVYFSPEREDVRRGVLPGMPPLTANVDFRVE